MRGRRRRSRDWTNCYGMARLQVHRPSRVGCSSTHCAYQRLQNLREDHLRNHGRQRTRFPFPVCISFLYFIPSFTELCVLSGYGYQPRIVSDLGDLDNDMAASLSWAVDEIHRIQEAARSGKPIVKPRWPVILLRTPKGMSAPQHDPEGNIIEGSFHSHQVPLPKAKTDQKQLALLQEWLRSYKPDQLFEKDGTPIEVIRRLIPTVNEKKLGQKAEVYKGYIPLKTPDWKFLGAEKGTQESCMIRIGQYLRDVIAAYVPSVVVEEISTFN